MGSVTVTLTLDLPEEIAAKAESTGILQSGNVERLIAAEVERQERVKLNLRWLAELRSLQPPITPEEIDEEIRLYREEKRQKFAEITVPQS